MRPDNIVDFATERDRILAERDPFFPVVGSTFVRDGITWRISEVLNSPTKWIRDGEVNVTAINASPDTEDAAVSALFVVRKERMT